MNKRLILLLLLCVSLILTTMLAGCSARTGSAGSEAGDDKAAATETTQEKEKVSLSVQTSYNPKLFTEFTEKFQQKNPEITLEWVFLDNANAQKIVLTQLAAGEGPDIIGVGANEIKAGLALELTGQPFIDRMSDAAKINCVEPDGQKYYKVALETWFQGIMYNKKIFADNNIQIPNTWSEFIDICKKLKTAGIKPISCGNKAGDVLGKQALGVVLSTGAIIEPEIESGKAKYSEKWKAGLTEWFKIVEEGIVGTDSFGMTVDDMVNEFLTGKAAMMDMGSWRVEEMHQKAPELEFDTMPYPAAAPGMEKWIIGGNGGGIGINANSKHQAEALKFLDFAVSPEGDILYIKGSKGGPAVKGVTGGIDPALSGLQESLTAGRTYAPWEGLKKIGGESFVRTWFKLNQEMVAKKKTVDEALKELDDYVATQLK